MTLLEYAPSELDERRRATPVAVPAAPPAERPARREARRWPDRLIALVAAAVVMLSHATRLAGGPFYSDDEGTYVAQAWSLIHEGRLSPYTYWYDHPPLGWILLAGWDLTVGRLVHLQTSVEDGRAFAVTLASVAGGLLYLLGRRLGLGCSAAAAAVALWAFSPLALSLSRMLYLDNIALPLLLASLWFASDRGGRLWSHVAAGALLGAAVLTKETFLLDVPAVAFVSWSCSRGRTRPYCVAGFATLFVGLVALYPLFALLKGELVPGPGHVSLLGAIRFQLFQRAGTGAVWDPVSPAGQMLRTWLRTDPYLLPAGLALVPLAAVDRRLVGPALAVLVPAATALRPNGYLPSPLPIALLPFCALLVAAGARRVAAFAGAWIAPAVSSLVLAASRRRVDPLRRLRVLSGGGGPRPRIVSGVVVFAVGVALVAGAGSLVGSRWRSTDEAIYHQNPTVVQVQAEGWIAAHVPHRARIVVDDTYWVDLVDRGFDPHLGVIWFYKLDFTDNLDPSVARALPAGYKDLGYVVVSPAMRAALAADPRGFRELRLAIRYSKLIFAVGEGPERVTVRKLDVPRGAPSLPSPVRP
jgi:hypothetical protein